jgi:hypothetical protein
MKPTDVGHGKMEGLVFIGDFYGIVRKDVSH